jgi:hypothetical protein
MSWTIEHRRVWRVAVLVLLLVATTGPWILDLIVVPSEYSCSAPAIRLEGDHCGIPMSGIWILAATTGVLVNTVVGLVTGTTGPSDLARAFSFSLLGLLLVLPFCSTMFSFLRADRRQQMVCHIAAMSLALGSGLLLAMSSYSSLSWRLWGIWLYVGVTATALMLEVVLLAGRTRPGRV